MQAISNSILDTVRQEFNFEVNKFPLFGPDNIKTPLYGLFRSDTGKIVGSGPTAAKSARYVPHTTDDILALTEAASVAFEGGSQVQCFFNNGHYVTVTPSGDYRRSIFGTKDNVFPRFHIRAGYDGKAAEGGLGYYRDACLNLSMLRQVGECFRSIRHNGKFRDRFDELVEVFRELRGGWDALTAAMEAMDQREVAIVEFVQRAFKKEPTTPKEITISENLLRDVLIRIGKERVKTGRPPIDGSFDGIVTAWEAYNGVQGYVQHNATRQTKDAFGRAVQAMRDPIVKRAEELALAA